MTQPSGYRELTQTVSAGLATLRVHTPAVMEGLGDLGRTATATAAFDGFSKPAKV